MALGIVAVFLFGVGFASATTGSSPILPAQYSKLIYQGFATNYFKSKDPLLKYDEKNIDDIYDKGFRNLRLRSRADLLDPPYNTSNANFTVFLDKLELVVDKCLSTGVIPIISWIHHCAEAYATEERRVDYVDWWRTVAEKLKDKDYRLGFNLFTELGLDGCGGTKEKCTESLRTNPDKYNNWTQEVVYAIRNTSGNNLKRILILGSPGKTGKDLKNIDAGIYKNDDYMMAEWHVYASGPNQRVGGAKYWSGDGKGIGRKNVHNAINAGLSFTNKTGILTYLGAWMPIDNKNGSLTQDEAIQFGHYFVCALRNASIPWSMNVLDRYYDTVKSEWLTNIQTIHNQPFNMSQVLTGVVDVGTCNKYNTGE